MRNWYVIQVQSGKEQAQAAEIMRVAGDVVDECFAPRWQTQQKFRGEWRYVTRNLIPGYVIAVTNDTEKLERRLHQISGMTHLLRTGGKLIPLFPDEVAWLDKFTQGGNRTIPMSTAVKEGERVIITDGPLREHQATITRIDRHRSKAYVQINILGRTKEVPVGLCVVTHTGQGT